MVSMSKIYLAALCFLSSVSGEETVEKKFRNLVLESGFSVKDLSHDEALSRLFTEANKLEPDLIRHYSFEIKGSTYAVNEPESQGVAKMVEKWPKFSHRWPKKSKVGDVFRGIMGSTLWHCKFHSDSISIYCWHRPS